MAKLVINVPDEKVAAVLEAFKKVYGRPEDVSPAVWAKTKIREYIIEVYRKAHVENAVGAAISRAHQESSEDTGGISVD